MSKIGFFKALRLRWFIHKHRQPTRNALSSENAFSTLPFQVFNDCAVFPDVAMAHVNDKLANEFMRKFPEVYVHKGVLEWDEAATSDIYGTPGIYIRDVFDVLPDGVVMGYRDKLEGQLLFIPMYSNLDPDE